MLNDSVSSIGGNGAADSALECAISEAVTPAPDCELQEMLPLRAPGGAFIRNVTYKEAHDLLANRDGKGERATLKRNRSGRIRYLELVYRPEDNHNKRAMGGSLITDASRTVRLQRLTPPYKTHQHIMQDLAEKQAVKAEELAADGVIAGPKEPK